MLPRKYRLTSDYDFRRVRRLGKPFYSRYFTLVVAKAKDPKTLRFGFIVSKKIDNRASVRNRVVRLLRETVASQVLAIPVGYDCVVIARKEAIGVALDDLQTEFKRVLKIAGL